LALSVSQRTSAQRFYATALLVFSVCAAVLVIATAVAAPALVPLVLGSDYGETAGILWLLVAAQLVGGAYYLVAIGLNISERTGDISRATWLAAASNVVLDFVLIPTFGYTGAAVATLVSLIVAAIVVWKRSRAVYPIPYNTAAILRIWFVALGALSGWAILVGPARVAVIIAALAVVAIEAIRAGTLRELRWSISFLRSQDPAVSP